MPARILLIEDNPANLDLMSYLLTAFGYTPMTAVDGGTGLATAHREKPDLIICDIQLPTMDGFEVARHIKSDPTLRSIPLIAVTAFAMVGDRDRTLAAGFDGHIGKPIDPETFVQQVEQFFPTIRISVASMHGPAEAFTPPKQANRHTVLVVDNLPVNLELPRRILD